MHANRASSHGKDIREIRHFHLFCGLGGGAKGFNRGKASVGNLEAEFRCIGGVDIDAAAIRDFSKAHFGNVQGTVLDMFNREQYAAFHGKEPPADWREAVPADIRKAAGNERPHIVFLSAPCKGFSGLLAKSKSKTDKYQALNQLTLRGIWLMLEAWADDPPEFVIFENVPLIKSARGRWLLDQIAALLQQYGYAARETTHDCGELGGLGQSRKRFLLVARHTEKVPPFLYEPLKRPLRSVGDVIGHLPLPGTGSNPMHRIPSLQWKTWVRLAFVEAGSDWRSLNRLAVEDGYLRDYLLIPDYRSDYLGVRRWDQHTGVVGGRSTPTNGGYSVADPRAPAGAAQYQQYGVLDFDDHAGAIIGVKSPGQGTFSVADPRTRIKHNNCFRVVGLDQSAGTITGGTGPSAGGQCVADPRPPQRELFGKYAISKWVGKTGTVIGGDDSGAYGVADPRPGFGSSTHHNVLRITEWDETGGTITSSTHPSGGALAVADPRPSLNRQKGDNYLTGGHYGIVPWDSFAGAVSAAACHDNGKWSVADPRLPAQNEKVVVVIRALDNTWHRPFTTLELAALQGLVDPEDLIELDGLSDQAWRERIGNAVPAPAAEAIASEMGRTLLMAWSGETFALSHTPLWVRNVAVALSLPDQSRDDR